MTSNFIFLINSFMKTVISYLNLIFQNIFPINVCIYKKLPPIFVTQMKVTESKYNTCLYFAANTLARKIEKLAIECWKPADLPPSHAYLLMMVLEEPGLHPGRIASHLQLSPSTITRLIEKLEERNLVLRKIVGRTTKVYPSNNGIILFPILRSCLAEFYTNSCGIIGKSESEKIVADMCLIADKL